MKSNGQKIYYFDHAAATPISAGALSAMQPYLTEQFANPSSLYSAARAARAAVETARRRVADILGAKSTEIVFTSGGTEGDNLAIQGVLRAHPGASWVTSAIEHDAVLSNAAHLGSFGHAVKVVPVAPVGLVSPAAIAGAVADDTVLVSIMYANNEIGTVQPIADIAKRIARIRSDRQKRGINLPLFLHTDAVQAPSYLSLHVDRLGIDLLSLSGSKIYGPKGTGILYIRHGTKIEPLAYGGGQERDRRSGTENVAGIVGFSEALAQAAAGRDGEVRRLTLLRDRFISQLPKILPEAVLNGDPARRLPNNVNITIPEAEGEGMVLYLDNQGIMASTGSACTTGSLDPSHVLLALGRTPGEANSSLRLTMGRATDESAIDAVLRALPPIVARLKQLSA